MQAKITFQKIDVKKKEKENERKKRWEKERNSVSPLHLINLNHWSQQDRYKRTLRFWRHNRDLSFCSCLLYTSDAADE